MANHCGFCDTRRPPPTEDYPHGTKIMVMGDDWVEFCEPCGDRYTLTNGETGEEKTLAEIFNTMEEN